MTHPNQAMQRAIEEMELQARKAVYQAIKRAPSLRGYQIRNLCGRDPETTPHTEMVHTLRRQKNSERKRCIEGHWTSSRTRLLALKQAYVHVRLQGLRKRAEQRRIANLDAAIDSATERMDAANTETWAKARLDDMKTDLMRERA